MNKITIIAAVAYAYATVAATSFALGFLLAPVKAQAGEGQICLREAPPHEEAAGSSHRRSGRQECSGAAASDRRIGLSRFRYLT